jgi:ABC-type transport system involved in multi-copper enzyme maturation permease subunit
MRAFASWNKPSRYPLRASMILRLRRWFAFPLLAKELAEAAARRRTFVIRIVYVVLLYGAFAIMVPDEVFSGELPISRVLGMGSEMFEILFVLQLGGIALFLPALMAGRIAHEKERDSLVLLLLTELRPMQIILQKYLGGLLPMLSFLLLALPLAAITYSLGGLTGAKVLHAVASTLLVTLQIGALALVCSAWCRSTAGAFLGTYFVGALFYAGPPLAVEFLHELHLLSRRNSLQGLHDAALLLPPVAVAMAQGSSWPKVLLYLAPSVLSVPILLGLARLFLIRRAFVPAGSFSLRLFRRIDKIMQRANRFVGDVTLIRDKVSFPTDAPIYWRETARRTLGKVHYLIRILVVVEIPTVMLCGLFSGGFETNYQGEAEELSMLLAFLMCLAVLGISVQAANTVVTERVQQTLEVLLTTPLTARTIVLEKARALRRLMIVAIIPLITVMGVECWIEHSSRHLREKDSSLAYLASAATTLGILLPMVSWLSLWIGLQVRTRIRAIITALAIIVSWCFLPIGIATFFMVRTDVSGWVAERITLLSPLTAGLLNEYSDIHEFAWTGDSPWGVILFTATFFGAATLLIRRDVLQNADRWLRR